jgi:hypothetical protein
MSLRKKISRRLKYSRGTSPQEIKNHCFLAADKPMLSYRQSPQQQLT